MPALLGLQGRRAGERFLTPRAPRLARLLLFVFLVQAALCGVSHAQSGKLHVTLHRLVGYSLGSQAQGAFELRADSESELVSVAYFIDDVPLGESSEAPFSVSFSTDDYAPGWHELRGEASTGDGQRLDSLVLRVEFVSSRAAWTVLRSIIVPAGTFVGAVVLIVFVLSLVTMRRRRSRKLIGRPDEPEVPEMGEPPAPRPAPRALSPEEELRRRIEDSRFTDL